MTQQMYNIRANRELVCMHVFLGQSTVARYALQIVAALLGLRPEDPPYMSIVHAQNLPRCNHDL